MTPPQSNAEPKVTAPSPPKKKGCGCFLWGCFGTLMVLFLLVVGSGTAIWFGMKNVTVMTDPVILWTYKNVARPKVIEMLPPNMSEAEKRRVLELMDSGVESYANLDPEQKKLILKEVVIASFYFSQDQAVPPEKIPNLTKFIQEHVQSSQKKPLRK